MLYIIIGIMFVGGIIQLWNAMEAAKPYPVTVFSLGGLITLTKTIRPPLDTTDGIISGLRILVGTPLCTIFYCVFREKLFNQEANYAEEIT